MKPTRLLSTAVGVLALTTTTDAGLVTWGTPQNIAGNSDVKTTGTLVRAFDFMGDVAGTTVNGVPFENKSQFSGAVGDFSFALTGGNVNNANPNGLSPQYNAMLKGGVTLSGAQTASITMNNLTLGDTYSFQWWSNLGSFIGDYRTQADGATGLDANLSGANGGTGQYQTGTFLATAPSQTVTFTGSGTPGVFGFNAIISGFQLRDLGTSTVPEPGTALFGLALCGVTAIRRRR